MNVLVKQSAIGSVTDAGMTFPFTRLDLRLNQPLIQCVLVVLYPMVKGPWTWSLISIYCQSKQCKPSRSDAQLHGKLYFYQYN